MGFSGNKPLSVPGQKDAEYASEAEGLSGEAVMGNATTVIPRVDESKIVQLRVSVTP